MCIRDRFQSGHRRYDQCNLGAWDDTGNPSYYGEDNWKYVIHDQTISNKPVLEDVYKRQEQDSRIFLS